MTPESQEQRLARLLRLRTFWEYSECLRLVRTKTSAEIEQLIAERKTGPAPRAMPRRAGAR